jgi:arylsulfatase A-like enzyme
MILSFPTPRRGPLLAALMLATTCPATRAAEPAKPDRPNILFILTDDLGYGDVGAFFQNARAAANNRAKPSEYTPQLDKLAAAGVQMRQHYCPAPVCAPSRASLLLGVTQGHANVRDNQFDKAIANNHTLASVLRQAGYATVAVGKWGLQGAGRNPEEWPAYPTRRGFDFFFGYARHKDGHEHYPKEGVYDGPKEVWDGVADISAQLDKCYTADLWTAWTKQWILAHQRTNSAQPFFIYLAYDTPHAVLEYPAAPYPAGGGVKGGIQWLGTPGHMINTAEGKVDSCADPVYAKATWDDDNNPATPEAPWPEVYKRYATSVRRIDQAVGDLLQLLQDLNLSTNTFIVFTSDNGPSIESYLPQHIQPTFFASYGPFDGIKRDCWEGGLRVPTIVSWPGHIPAGATNNLPSGFWDWMPTFADLAGLPAPARSDGVSLLPALTGLGQQQTPQVYIEYFEQGKTPSFPEFLPSHRGRTRKQMQLLRLGDYLGVRYNVARQSDDFEIYNVVADPQEATNLAANPAFADLQQRLKTGVLQMRRPNASAPRPYDQEFVPAATPPKVVPGVAWRTFESPLPWVAKLEDLNASARGYGARPDNSLLPATKRGGALFTGFIKVPAEGVYTFEVTADGGALLRIHEATVIDADYGYTGGAEVSGVIRLKAGLHPFRLYYRRGTADSPSLTFKWSNPAGLKSEVPASALFR